MDDTYEQITKKEAELEKLENLLTDHKASRNNLIMACGIGAFNAQTDFIEARLRLVKREIKALEAADFVAVQIARRNARYPLIEPIRPIKIEFIEDEESINFSNSFQTAETNRENTQCRLNLE